MNKLIILAFVSLCVASQAAVIRNETSFPLSASAEIVGKIHSAETNETSVLSGTVRFEQMTAEGGVFVTVSLSFDRPASDMAVLRGIHVHTNPISEEKCGTAGGHWNPEGVTHGWLTSLVHHAGDLGNFRFSPEGIAHAEVRSFDLSLFGKKSIINRSVVVHMGMDDGGLGEVAASKKSGNAGPKIACGTILKVE